MSAGDKIYLGDSVYLTNIGYALMLTTENGLPDDPSNRVIVDGSDIARLVEFCKKEGLYEQ